jgi:UDP-2,4-diacetamido-2,4,6-trideoxy-beta-L-altropyranose hydrolase
MNLQPTLLLRADAGSSIGTGHVMRCLALAQAWQDAGGEVVFASALMPDALGQRLCRENFRCEQIRGAVGSVCDAEETLEIARSHDARWLVADGYRFDPGYLASLHRDGAKLLAIDDMAHLEHYPVDVLLNQNLGATHEYYANKVSSETILLLGPGFSLLRREFRRAEKAASRFTASATREDDNAFQFSVGRFAPQPPPKSVLITLGGADAENFTGQILLNLIASGRRDFDVLVLAGAANPHGGELRALADTAPFSCEVRVNVDDVSVLMGWADVAITAAGSTVWELAAMRLPALIGAFEQNQLVGLSALQRLPLFRARKMEDLLACDLAAELDLLPARGGSSGEFDGAGAIRVVEHLKSADIRTALALAST